MTELQTKINENEAYYDKPGLFRRVIWTITSPGKLMEELAQRPRVLLGILISAISMEALYFLRLPLFKESLRSAVIASSQLMEEYTGQAMTAKMIENQVASSLKIALISTPFTAILSILFITIIFFAILKIIGGQGKFKAYFSVVSYSSIISSLYILIVLGVSFITNSLHEDIPLTSLAIIASDDMSGTFLYGLLKGIDVFSIWRFAVMAIGFAAVSRLKKPYVYVAVAVVFIIGLLLTGGRELALGVFS